MKTFSNIFNFPILINLTLDYKFFLIIFKDTGIFFDPLN